MNSEQFCFWLQGYVEIAASRSAPTSEEWNVIRDRLNNVFPPSKIVIASPYNFPPNEKTGSCTGLTGDDTGRIKPPLRLNGTTDSWGSGGGGGSNLKISPGITTSVTD